LVSRQKIVNVILRIGVNIEIGYNAIYAKEIYENKFIACIYSSYFLKKDCLYCFVLMIKLIDK
jgi:hypothetical protein